MTIEDFIKELKPLVRYNKEKDLHIMGSTILTNQEVNHMLHIMIGEDYDKLSSNKRTKMRQRVFKELM